MLGTAKTFLYFSYGSNLLAQRIRINSPSAKRSGIAKLKDYRLDFVTYSVNWKGASATIVPSKGSYVWGALWEIANVHLESLDRQEGVGSGIYFPLTVGVTSADGKELYCRTYRQTVNIVDVYQINDLPNERKPSAVYLKTILKGAQESGLPDEYQQYLNTIPHNGYEGDIDIGKKLDLD